MLGLPLDTMVMLGPILEALFLSRYVRSVSGDFVMLGIVVQTVTLGPIPEALGDTCYVRSISGDFVMLVPFLESFVSLGLLMDTFVSLG